MGKGELWASQCRAAVEPLLLALSLLNLVTGLVDAACYLGWVGCSPRT